MRYAEAIDKIDRLGGGKAPSPTFFDNLAGVILRDFETQRKVAEAFTTYQARGNREDLA